MYNENKQLSKLIQDHIRYSKIFLLIRIKSVFIVFVLFLVDCNSAVPHFKCRTDVCLEYRFICDGVTDCVNGTDEKNCSKFVLIQNQ